MFKSFLRQLFRSDTGDQGRKDFAQRHEAAIDPALAQAVEQFNAGKLDAALTIAEGVVRNDVRCHQAWNLLGAVAAATGNLNLAIPHFERAIALEPASADYLSNCGEACRRAGRIDDALACCRGALAIDSRHAGAGLNLALTLHSIGEVEEACAAVKNTLAAHPGMRAPRSALLFLLCHHPGMDAAAILAEHRRWNELHASALAPKSASRAVDTSHNRKLRIGYVSADFRGHSLSYFIEPLLAHHDRARFEVYCYHNSRRADEVTERLRAYASRWRDIAGQSDEEVAGLVARDDIDILVDLGGYTADSRPLVFARKPAPMQVSYLGYLNTTGIGAMDYRLTDGIADPPGVAETWYTEKLLRMPHSQWCYRPPEDMPEVSPLPALQRGKITFGSLHSLTKINFAVIELWAQLLTRIPDSLLVIASVPGGETGQRLRDRFAAHGIDPARLELIGKVNFDDYLRLHHRIDIALDTFPYNGATTTCESLWMGVPVITMAGQYAAARSGASLLATAGLGELIASNPDQYIDIATELARDPHRLADLRAGLRDRLKHSPLRDEAAFTRAFENILHEAFYASVRAST